MSKQVIKTAYLYLTPDGGHLEPLGGRTGNFAVPLAAAAREIPKMAARLHGEGIRRLVILAPAGIPEKLARDILPALIQDAKAQYPEMDFNFCPTGA